MSSSTPNRGEVWLVDLDYVAKVRLCLVMNIPIEDIDRALVSLVPHTTRPRGSRFEVDIQARFLRPGVFDGQNLFTASEAKLIRKLGALSNEQLAQVEEAVKFWLGLDS